MSDEAEFDRIDQLISALRDDNDALRDHAIASLGQAGADRRGQRRHEGLEGRERAAGARGAGVPARPWTQVTRVNEGGLTPEKFLARFENDP